MLTYIFQRRSTWSVWLKLLWGRPLSTSRYFGPILTPIPRSHFVTHLGTPPKVCHTSGIPSQFLVVYAYIHVFTGGFVLVHGAFDRGFCPGLIVCKVLSGMVFVRPLLSEYIHYNRMLNITSNFRFHMYQNLFKVWRHMLLDPSLCHNLSHLGPPPLERHVLYERPLSSGHNPQSFTLFIAYPWKNQNPHPGNTLPWVRSRDPLVQVFLPTKESNNEVAI